MAYTLLHPDDDFSSLNLKDLIFNLSVIIEDLTDEFTTFDSPVVLLLPYETHRAAADALSASLRLRNQLKYFNAGFPRSSNFCRRASSLSVAQNIPYTVGLPSKTCLDVLNSPQFLDAVSHSPIHRRHLPSCITHPRGRLDIDFPNQNLPPTRIASNSTYINQHLHNNSFPANEGTCLKLSHSSSPSASSSSNEFSKHQYQHYYHFEEAFDDLYSNCFTQSNITKSLSHEDNLVTPSIDFFTPTSWHIGGPPQFYKSLLEREEHQTLTYSIIQREKRILCISLSLPFLSIRERFTLIAKLSVGFHRLVMFETPMVEADFCNIDTEGLLLLPVELIICS